MKIFKTAILFTILTGLTLFATGCPEHRSIAEIERNPGRYQNKQVIITGRVVDSYGVSVPGLGGGGAYKVDDGTGSIWVLATDRGVPARMRASWLVSPGHGTESARWFAGPPPRFQPLAPPLSFPRQTTGCRRCAPRSRRSRPPPALWPRPELQ